MVLRKSRYQRRFSMIDADGTSRKRAQMLFNQSPLKCGMLYAMNTTGRRVSFFFCFRISKGDGDIPAVTNEEMC
jgi:hypothetical protein